MTIEILRSVIYSGKKEYLVLNKTYNNGLLIGSKSSTVRQKELLKALDIYIDMLEYYLDIKENAEELNTSISSSDADNLVELIVQTLHSFKTSYYG